MFQNVRKVRWNSQKRIFSKKFICLYLVSRDRGLKVKTPYPCLPMSHLTLHSLCSKSLWNCDVNFVENPANPHILSQAEIWLKAIILNYWCFLFYLNPNVICPRYFWKQCFCITLNKYKWGGGGSWIKYKNIDVRTEMDNEGFEANWTQHMAF